MTFLESKRTTESYFENKLKNKSKSFGRNTEKALKYFENFCVTLYNKPGSAIIEELNRLENSRKEIITYEVIQKFVNYMSDRIRPNTLATYFTSFKPYLAYMTYSKLHAEDVRANVVFPQFIEEEAYPMTKEQIKEILEHSSHKRKGLYLTSASSGIRGQELCKLRKRDFVMGYKRIMIKLPAAYTKTKKARRTFVSKEAEPYVLEALDAVKDDDLVFTRNLDSEKAIANERMIFDFVRSKTTLDNLRYESGTHKITIHSFRSFFITMVEPVNEGLGHALSGHSKEQKRYERYSDEQLLEFYIQIEPKISVFENDNRSNNDDELLKEMQTRQEKMEYTLQRTADHVKFLESKIKQQES